jgi:hypothetical protein
MFRAAPNQRLLNCLLQDVVEEPFAGAVGGNPFRTERRSLLNLSQGGEKRAIQISCTVSFHLGFDSLWYAIGGPVFRRNSRSALIETQGASVMKRRQGYKGYVIEARSCELKDGGFSAEFSVEEHDASGVTETQFYLPDTFPSQELAVAAATQAGRQKIDVGFERGRAVVNG